MDSGWLGRFSSSGAGAVVSAAGEALLPGRDGGLPGGSGKTGGARSITYRLYTDPCIVPTKRGGSRKRDTPIREMAIENLENLC